MDNPAIVVDVLAMTQAIAGIAPLAPMTCSRSLTWTGPAFAVVRVRPFRRECIFEMLLDIEIE